MDNHGGIVLFLPSQSYAIPFFSSIVLDWTYRKMLKSSGEIEHACSFPELRQKTSTQSPINITLASGLWQMAFNKLRK